MKPTDDVSQNQDSDMPLDGEPDGLDRGKFIFCDPEGRLALFRLDHGKWAGRPWVARLEYCEDPLCDCCDVDFYCVPCEKPIDRKPLLFSLDPIECRITPNDGRDRPHASAGLAKGLVAELDEDDWHQLYEFIMIHKRKAILEMDIDTLENLPPPELMTQDDKPLPYTWMFPFAEIFTFEVDDVLWEADDFYCLMPGCECREVVLSFLCPFADPDGNLTVTERVPIAVYDYQHGTIQPKGQPASGDPLLETLVAALRTAYPCLCQDLEQRHGQLRALYKRAEALEEQRGEVPYTLFVRAEPKTGRNDPCPCGSGKKFKKCCGRADRAT